MKKLKIVDFRFNLYVAGQFIGCFENENYAMDYAKEKYPSAGAIIVPVDTYSYKEE